MLKALHGFYMKASTIQSEHCMVMRFNLNTVWLCVSFVIGIKFDRMLSNDRCIEKLSFLGSLDALLCLMKAISHKYINFDFKDIKISS